MEGYLKLAAHRTVNAVVRNLLCTKFMSESQMVRLFLRHATKEYRRSGGIQLYSCLCDRAPLIQ